MTTPSRPMAAGLLAAALLLGACGDDARQDEGAASATTPPESAAAAADPTDDPVATTEATDVAVEPFDPDATVPLTDLEVRGERAFPDGLIPDDLVVPAGTTVATYDSEDSDTEQYRNATGALRVDDPSAEVDEVMAFFREHLPAAGWELEEERDSGLLVWHKDHPEERVLTREFRVEAIKPDENAIIRWWFTNNG